MRKRSICCLFISFIGAVRSWKANSTSSIGCPVRMDSRSLVMAPLHELKAEGVWLFPKLRLVELYLSFFSVWLRRELQRGKYSHLKLSADEWDEKAAVEEEQYLGFCRRLAFAMFKRGVTSWTVQHEQEQPLIFNRRQQTKAKQAAAKAQIACSWDCKLLF